MNLVEKKIKAIKNSFDEKEDSSFHHENFQQWIRYGSITWLMRLKKYETIEQILNDKMVYELFNKKRVK